MKNEIPTFAIFPLDFLHCTAWEKNGGPCPWHGPPTPCQVAAEHHRGSLWQKVMEKTVGTVKLPNIFIYFLAFALSIAVLPTCSLLLSSLSFSWLWLWILDPDQVFLPLGAQVSILPLCLFLSLPPFTLLLPTPLLLLSHLSLYSSWLCSWEGHENLLPPAAMSNHFLSSG